MSTNKNSKKSKIPTNKFPLIKETSISGVLRPKGYVVSLTLDGEKDFRKKNRIK
jgi:hypothetical protein